ncbi:MAG: hypothetical protein H6729_04115 [Deltaproteobacteria bacterium]|nr:hypothetical protein [Deltaproteobacteria bacterium]
MGRGANMPLSALRRLPTNEISAQSFLRARARRCIVGSGCADQHAKIEERRRPRKLSVGARPMVSTALNSLGVGLNAWPSSLSITQTDEDAWRTFDPLSDGARYRKSFLIATRAGPILMFPTLEQALREGKANVRVVVKASPLDTLFLSASVSSRGGGWGFRAGPVGASMTNFEHELKFNLPGICGLSVGEDYAYGPMLTLGYSPKMDALTWRLPVNVRGGGQLKIYHEGLRPLTDPTRHAAEVFANIVELAHRGIAEVSPKITGKRTRRSVRRGWPSSEYWQHVRRKVERIAGAYQAAELRLQTLHALQVAEPNARHPGGEQSGAVERARLEARAQRFGLSADEASAFPKIAIDYLEGFTKDVLRDLAVIERAGQRAKAEEGYNRPILMNTLRRLEGRTKAFEFCDTLFRKILAGEPRSVAAENAADHA